ncbi:hypothetical protein GCM10027200_08340 [Lentzea nigeriaca]
MVATDDAPAVERPNPLQAGRGGDAELAGEFAVGLPSICLEKPDNLRIKFVHGRQLYRIFTQSFGHGRIQ